MRETDKHVISHCELKWSSNYEEKETKEYSDGNHYKWKLLGENKESNGR